MIDPELLRILCCPETHQELSPATGELVEKLNAQVAGKTLHNRAGKAVGQRIDGGLVREDGKYLYPIRGTIPIMLIDEAIAI